MIISNGITIGALRLRSNNNEYELINSVVGLEIYEGVNQLSVGEIVFLESENLYSEIKKDAWMIISFSDSVGGGFLKTYKIDQIGREIDDEMRNVITARLITPYEYIDSRIGVSMTYKNKSASQIVEHCVASLERNLPVDYKYSFEGEEDLYQVTFTAPYCSPLEVIRWCKQNAISKTNSPLWFFYDDLNGIKFTSIDNLISQTPITMVRMNNIIESINKQGVVRQWMEYNKYDVEDLNFTENLVSYQYNVSKRDFKVLYNKPSQILFQLNGNIKREDVTESGGIDLSGNSTMGFSYSTENAYEPNEMAPKYAERYTILANLGRCATFETDGNINIKAGSIINLVCYDADGKPEKDTGLWFVKSVKHFISRTTYTQTITVVSDLE